MTKQLEIDWENVVQHSENNRHSEQILEQQYKRLNRNCRRLYEAMQNGEWWSGIRIVTELKMIEYRRRIADLKDNGFLFDEKILSDGSKKWRLKTN